MQTSLPLESPRSESSDREANFSEGGDRDYTTQAKIHQAIIGTLDELGVSNATFSISDTTMLVQDGFCVGRSLVRGHVRVVMLSGGERIEFHDKSDGILRVVRPPQSVIMQPKAA